jgi:hypothetical protein
MIDAAMIEGLTADWRQHAWNELKLDSAVPSVVLHFILAVIEKHGEPPGV